MCQKTKILNAQTVNFEISNAQTVHFEISNAETFSPLNSFPRAFVYLTWRNVESDVAREDRINLPVRRKNFRIDNLKLNRTFANILELNVSPVSPVEVDFAKVDLF